MLLLLLSLLSLLWFLFVVVVVVVFVVVMCWYQQQEDTTTSQIKRLSSLTWNSLPFSLVGGVEEVIPIQIRDVISTWAPLDHIPDAE